MPVSARSSGNALYGSVMQACWNTVGLRRLGCASEAPRCAREVPSAPSEETAAAEARKPRRVKELARPWGIVILALTRERLFFFRNVDPIFWHEGGVAGRICRQKWKQP